MSHVSCMVNDLTINTTLIKFVLEMEDTLLLHHPVDGDVVSYRPSQVNIRESASEGDVGVANLLELFLDGVDSPKLEDSHAAVRSLKLLDSPDSSKLFGRHGSLKLQAGHGLDNLRLQDRIALNRLELHDRHGVNRLGLNDTHGSLRLLDGDINLKLRSLKLQDTHEADIFMLHDSHNSVRSLKLQYEHGEVLKLQDGTRYKYSPGRFGYSIQNTLDKLENTRTSKDLFFADSESRLNFKIRSFPSSQSRSKIPKRILSNCGSKTVLASGSQNVEVGISSTSSSLTSPLTSNFSPRSVPSSRASSKPCSPTIQKLDSLMIQSKSISEDLFENDVFETDSDDDVFSVELAHQRSISSMTDSMSDIDSFSVKTLIENLQSVHDSLNLKFNDIESGLNQMLLRNTQDKSNLTKLSMQNELMISKLDVIKAEAKSLAIQLSIYKNEKDKLFSDKRVFLLDVVLPSGLNESLDESFVFKNHSDRSGLLDSIAENSDSSSNHLLEEEIANILNQIDEASETLFLTKNILSSLSQSDESFDFSAHPSTVASNYFDLDSGSSTDQKVLGNTAPEVSVSERDCSASLLDYVPQKPNSCSNSTESSLIEEELSLDGAAKELQREYLESSEFLHMSNETSADNANLTVKLFDEGFSGRKAIEDSSPHSGKEIDKITTSDYEVIVEKPLQTTFNSSLIILSVIFIILSYIALHFFKS